MPAPLDWRAYFSSAPHTHEIMESERPEDKGVLYCTLCDRNLSDINDEDEVSFK